jgi:hypothetical protein
MQQVKQPYIIDQYPEDQGEDNLPGYDEYEQAEDQDNEIETLYVYTYDPEEPLFHLPRLNKDQIIAAIMGLLALAMIVGACFIPSGQSYSIQTISVPARFHTLQLKASSAIVPTGKKEYPASRATGTLTFFNGGFLTEQIPANFILTTKDGIEVATDQAVIIPANNPPSNGEASVSAHAVVAGSSSNIEAYAINQIYGSDVYVKNLAAFSGGQDAYTKTFVTANDKATALTAARAQLDAKTPIGLQRKPCTDTSSQAALNLTVTRLCEYITYQSPSNGQILSVRVQGDKVFLTVKSVARVVTTHFVK